MVKQLDISAFIRKIKKTLFRWLVAAVLAGLAVLFIHWLLLPERGKAIAMIGYGYTGIEYGNNPLGNRFDPDEIKSAEVIRAAGESLQRTFSDEEVERIREHIYISGSVPENVIDQIVTYRSDIADSQVSMTANIRKSAYYPTRYQVWFDCKGAGFGGREGDALFRAVLDSYRNWFYEEYGYNASVEDSMRAFDYREYDYDNAVMVFESDLTLLRSYLSALAEKDSTRFVSQETGYSFLDLANAVDVICSEDLSRARSYILYNNLTRHKQEKIDYYNFKLQKAEQDLKAEEERLEVLSELIDGYEKTQAVIAGNTAAGSYSVTRETVEGDVAQSGEEEEEAAAAYPSAAAGDVFVYQVSQQSDTYDSLISQRVSCETSIAKLQEEMDYYSERMQKYRANANAGNADMAEEMLAHMDEKVVKLLDDTTRTAKDFYENVWLKNAVQELEMSGSSGLHAGKLFRASMLDVIAVEAVCLGLWILFGMVAVIRPERGNANVKTEEQAEAVQHE